MKLRTLRKVGIAGYHTVRDWCQTADKLIITIGNAKRCAILPHRFCSYDKTFLARQKVLNISKSSIFSVKFLSSRFQIRFIHCSVN